VKKTPSRWISLALALLMLPLSVILLVMAVQPTAAEPNSSFTLTCPESGIIANVPAGVLPYGTELRLGGRAFYNMLPGHGWQIAAAEEIEFYYNNARVQPNGQVEIRMPIAASFTGDHAVLIVRHDIVSYDGIKWPAMTTIPATAIDGYMVFSTNLTGLFGIWTPPGYPPLGVAFTLICPDSGVVVHVGAGVLPEGTELRVETNNTTLSGERISPQWTISYFYNGTAIQPVTNFTVEMRLPIPASFAGDLDRLQVRNNGTRVGSSEAAGFMVLRTGLTGTFYIVERPAPAAFTLTDAANGVIVNVPAGMLPVGTNMTVEATNVVCVEVPERPGEEWRWISLDIKFFDHGVQVYSALQFGPDGQVTAGLVTMRLRIPEGLSIHDPLSVWEWLPFQERPRIIPDVRVEGNYLVFETYGTGIFTITCSCCCVCDCNARPETQETTTATTETTAETGTTVATTATTVATETTATTATTATTETTEASTTIAGTGTTVTTATTATTWTTATTAATETTVTTVFTETTATAETTAATTVITATSESTTTEAPETTIPQTYMTLPSATSPNQGAPPPQTGASLSVGAASAAVILAMGGTYFGWCFFKKAEAT